MKSNNTSEGPHNEQKSAAFQHHIYWMIHTSNVYCNVPECFSCFYFSKITTLTMFLLFNYMVIIYSFRKWQKNDKRLNALILCVWNWVVPWYSAVASKKKIRLVDLQPDLHLCLLLNNFKKPVTVKYIDVKLFHEEYYLQKQICLTYFFIFWSKMYFY